MRVPEPAGGVSAPFTLTLRYPRSSGVSMQPLKAEVQLVARSGDVDLDAPVATFEVPSGADLIQVGDLLVSVARTTSSYGIYRFDGSTFNLLTM